MSLRGGENEMNGCRTLKELEAQVGEKVIEIFQSSSAPPTPTLHLPPTPPPALPLVKSSC